MIAQIIESMKNNKFSSITSTSTILTSDEASLHFTNECSSPNKRITLCMKKWQQLQEILKSTIQQQLTLKNQQKLLLQTLQNRKQILKLMLSNEKHQLSNRNLLLEGEDVTLEFSKTKKYGQPFQTVQTKSGISKIQKKNHHFYSTVQTPRKYSPEQFQDKITINNYQISRFCPSPQTVQKQNCQIKKQNNSKICDKNTNVLLNEYILGQKNKFGFKTIEQIWNQVKPPRKIEIGHCRQKSQIIQSKPYSYL